MDREVAGMGELKQGELTSKEYAEKAEGLFVALGDEHSVMLANKFLQGLRDPMLKYVMDGHLEAPLRFREVIRVFTRCTQTLRQEEAARHPKPPREDPKVENPMDLVVETMKQSQQMVGDLVKGINLLTTAGQDQMYYRPIAGTVGVERRQDQQNNRPGYQPNVDQANPPQQQDRNQAYQPPQQRQGYQQAQQHQAYQPPQRQGYQEYQNRGFRPRGDITCYSCGEIGHRSYECRARNQGNAQDRGPISNQGMRKG